MPAILKENSTASKISENLSQSFKKSEKENYETNPTPTIKQVLSAKIEYEEIPNFTNTLSSLQTKYITLKPNQQPLLNVQTAKTQYNANEKNNINGSSTSSSSLSTHNKLPQPKRILFPKDKIQIGWNLSGQTRNWGSGCGFNNIGNTCYLNSALQAFFHVPALAQWLLSDKEHREKSSCKDNQQCLICAMANTLVSTQRSNLSSFTPSSITNRLSNICKHLRLGHQEDAHEFLRYLIEKMEKSFLNRYRNEMWFKDLDQYSKETTPINQVLGGYLRSTVTCLSCNHESVTFQHFQDLPLDISLQRVTSLNEAIQGYFSRENLEECGYKCESCKKRVSASKRFSLERAPTVLCIQLKRFTAMGGKLSKHITISEKLNLKNFLSKNNNDLSQNCLYRFVSMVTHLGSSASGGHYTAVGMGPNGHFYNFDDSRVSSISIDMALRGNAYVLFYELVQQSPKSYESSLHNGHHSIFHQNGHTYVKNGIEMNSTNGLTSSISKCNISSSNSNSMYDKIRTNDASFSKPSLPSMFTTDLIKQEWVDIHEVSSKNENTTNGNVSNKSINGSPKNSSMNGINASKVESSKFEQDQKNEIGIKRLKFERSPLPSVPRLIDENESVVKSPMKSPQSNPSTSTQLTPTKPKSLVPYDDDDDEAPPEKIPKSTPSTSAAKFCKTSSGIFIETDFKEGPSKQGSTIVTKASNGVNLNINGKHSVNGHSSVNHNDDSLTQLKKLNHSGYGSQNVMSWNDRPSNMSKEVARDQNEDRKRHMMDDDEDMDRGRVKKIKYNGGQRSISPVKNKKLPNPFNEHQNMMNNQNGYDRYYERQTYSNNTYRPNFYSNNNNNSRKNYNSNNNMNNHRNFNNNNNNNKYNNRHHSNHKNSNHNRNQYINNFRRQT